MLVYLYCGWSMSGVRSPQTSRATAKGSALERRSPMYVWMSLKISTASLLTIRSVVTIMGFLMGSLLHASMLAMDTFLLNRPFDSMQGAEKRTQEKGTSNATAIHDIFILDINVWCFIIFNFCKKKKKDKLVLHFFFPVGDHWNKTIKKVLKSCYLIEFQFPP